MFIFFHHFFLLVVQIHIEWHTLIDIFSQTYYVLLPCYFSFRVTLGVACGGIQYCVRCACMHNSMLSGSVFNAQCSVLTHTFLAIMDKGKKKQILWRAHTYRIYVYMNVFMLNT